MLLNQEPFRTMNGWYIIGMNINVTDIVLNLGMPLKEFSDVCLV